MQIIRYILATTLGCLGIWIVIMNWLVIYAFVKHNKKSSGTPFVGAILLIFALLILPFKIPLWIFVIPLIIDYSCFPWIIYKTYRRIKRW
ncbi:hypothetical protein [uncultured Ruminococcus sp.]|uniref:hypothetical protein n=1 Tax=uncultured Ruminococcus sp. TaxID=165186 RepID=UPI0026096456|nr:hypothetical protein [uncultured Ruminococcus sp.]